jgi:hypothetical protein
MKKFKEFLREGMVQNHPHFVSSTINPETPHIKTTSYVSPESSIGSFMHTNTNNNDTYWGWGNMGDQGQIVDTPQEGVSKTMRSAKSRDMRSHLLDFAKNNPQVENITYQTNPGLQGEKNHEYFQKMWSEMQQEHGIKTKLTRVDANPLKSVTPKTNIGNIAAGLGAGLVGGLVGEYVVKPAAEKAGVFKAVESGTRSALSASPDWVAKVADPALGAAKFALDPLGTYSEFLAQQARMSPPLTQKQKDKATERFERKNY